MQVETIANGEPEEKNNGQMLIDMNELAETRRRYGYRRLTVLLQREGWAVNHERVYELYRRENLAVRTKKRKKRASHLRVVPPTPTGPRRGFGGAGTVDVARYNASLRTRSMASRPTTASLAMPETGCATRGYKLWR